MIEPINTRDMPGYFLNRQDEAHAIVDEIGSPSLKVQLALYHCQIVEGDVSMKLRQYLGKNVGHLQVASVPDRNEPDQGEINYDYLFGLIEELGYNGWIGCEYRPKAGTSEGLQWLKKRRLADGACHPEEHRKPGGLSASSLSLRVEMTILS